MNEFACKFAEKELNKCRDNPYYWATTYLTIKSIDGKLIPFTTSLSEQEFNNKIKDGYYRGI